MNTLSPGVMLSWNIGAAEAAMSHYEFLERTHILIGLCALEDTAGSLEGQKLATQFGDLGYLKEEILGLDQYLSGQRIDRLSLVRTLRQVAGHGSYRERQPRDVVHRSAACKRAFDKAIESAQQQRAAELHSLHLLAGIFEEPGPHVLQAFAMVGANLEALKTALQQTIAAFKPPQLQPVAPEASPAGAGILEQFGSDLTELARQGKTEPLVGRKRELLQLIRTLARKTKNNPLLLGDPGVGKTAIVRALAARIADGNVATELRGKRIIELNMATLVAGTKYRGEYEERLTQLVTETKSRPEVILFLDEIHTIVGAGHSHGGLDAANILKPALSLGEMHCIGSTTMAEYRKYFERDAALARRFQPIHVDEPSPEETLHILEGLKQRYEEFHRVTINPPTLKAAVELSVRYLRERRLPDKALDLLDEACTRVKVGSVSFRQVVVEDGKAPAVTPEVVAQVVSEMTNIPVARLTGEQQKRLQDMAQILRQHVVGQVEAIERVTNVIKMAKAGLRDSNRPVGVFLFVGPTGVGKTQLAKALAEFLFGSENNVVRLDMSEYMEKQAASRLIGAPPGYVGYEEGGQLTERLRRKPYSVILFDEIEKAHPEVFDLLLQLFDEGRLTDSQGTTIDGRHAIYIMTSNLTTTPAASVGFVPGEREARHAVADSRQAIISDLQQVFRSEFINRIDEVILFRSLSIDDVVSIVKGLLSKLGSKAAEQNVLLEFSEEAVHLIAELGYEPANGARPLARAVERLVGRPLSAMMIDGSVQPGDAVRVNVEERRIVLKVEEPEEDKEPTQ